MITVSSLPGAGRGLRQAANSKTACEFLDEGQNDDGSSPLMGYASTFETRISVFLGSFFRQAVLHEEFVQAKSDKLLEKR